ncbi:fasciclin domain-containing protein [Roseateles hydrophilus]|uniref:fasciclin domain-containing protein n=1 Tax=Roseateles hydrophilus TaxID=2975054 RepID=UPI002DD41B8E|nr:fasciclin domain-containing protein [Pelomonas sp. UHG3]
MLSLQWLKRLSLVAWMGFLGACGGSDPAPDIVDTARSDARFSVLAEAIDAADLAGTLSGSGPFTVFAPTNDAFAALLSELKLTKAQLLADKALLRAVLQYHVLPAQVLKAGVPAGRAITPLAGGVFKIDARGSDLIVTDGRNRNARITATDLTVRNGVLHVVDAVLLPANRNIVETAQATAAFSTLVEAVVAANLQGTLSGTGPFTVFAPTNDAFAAALAELGLSKGALLADTALLSKILTYHVVPSRVLKAEVPVGAAITTVEGQSFTVDASLAITDRLGRKATIVGTDVLASNGVVHVIDKVILPSDVTLPSQRTLVQQLQAMPQFSTLVEAVVAADLQDALSGAGPLTVFAPTNTAFAALLTELGLTKAQLLADKPLLTAVLQYHVLGSQVTSAAVPLGQAVSPLAGGIFKVDAQGSGLVVTDGRNRQASVGFVDLRVKNGVIHALDKVLLPANRDIVQTAQALPQFSILVEAVVAANLQGALSGTGPLTVFAPTNDAFAALLTELGVSKADLLANTALLTQVLTYHVVPGRVLKAGVPLNTAITTLQGESFTVNSSLAITDQRNRRAGIAATDVLTSNGVIHVIDRVILPRP